MPSPITPVRVALLGCGTVGTAVATTLVELSDDLCHRIGAPLELVGIAVHHADAPRGPAIDPSLITTDAEALVDRADIVVEVMGGIEPARSLIKRALDRGASVVSANKALLAEHGPELYAVAARAGLDLCYEAAVAGAIPILRPIRESLAGDKIERVAGIVNGTTNFVLDAMTTGGLSFDGAVAQAQRLGYAEADPTADVEGFDAAAKIAILASLAFHSRVSLADVRREGISQISAADVAAATSAGYVIKLLAIAERRNVGGAEGIIARVHPALIPAGHPLARATGVANAIAILAEGAGSLVFYGPGAGGPATASAVVGDLVSAARHRVHGGSEPGESAYAALPAWPMDALEARYQIRVGGGPADGADWRVLADCLDECGVGTDSVRHILPDPGPGVPGNRPDVVLVTRPAGDRNVRQAIAAWEQAVGHPDFGGRSAAPPADALPRNEFAPGGSTARTQAGCPPEISQRVPAMSQVDGSVVSVIRIEEE